MRRGDVLAAWSGIRPLVLNPNAKDTQSIARNHIIEVSPSKLITIAGKIQFDLLHCPVFVVSNNICWVRWKMDHISPHGRGDSGPGDY